MLLEEVCGAQRDLHQARDGVSCGALALRHSA
jgi:hypothetical protein